MDIQQSKRVRTQARLFNYEWELKMQLRKELDRIEPGLIAADGGRERAVSTGKIDITALDKYGNYVAIELKVGPCPTGALEQVMGYANDLEAETGKPCRAMIVASEFSDRLRAASLRARDVRLIHYQVEQMDFSEMEVPAA
jgi:RecB family endonuclease NucS